MSTLGDEFNAMFLSEREHFVRQPNRIQLCQRFLEAIVVCRLLISRSLGPTECPTFSAPNLQNIFEVYELNAPGHVINGSYCLYRSGRSDRTFAEWRSYGTHNTKKFKTLLDFHLYLSLSHIHAHAHTHTLSLSLTLKPHST